MLIDQDETVVELVKISSTEMREIMGSLPEEQRTQLRRALSLVLICFQKPDWECVVVASNEKQSAMIIASSPGVNDMYAVDILSWAKDIALDTATMEAPDKSKWS